MDVALCCLSKGTTPSIQLCFLKWAFILYQGPVSIFRGALGEFFSCVDYIYFISKCQRSGCVDPSSPEISSAPEKVWKMLFDCFSIILTSLVWWEIIWPLNYSDLSRHPIFLSYRSVCSWMCTQYGLVILTFGWSFFNVCLLHQEHLTQD